MNKNLSRILALTIAASVSACSTTGPNLTTSRHPRGFATVEFPDADYLLVFDAAERALSEEHRIAHRNIDSGIIRSVPVELSDPTSGTRTLSDAPGTVRRTRKLVEFRVRRAGRNVVVTCRALVQQDRTEQVRMFDQDRGALDAPTDTPAERLAGTTLEQNTYWTDDRRDRATERRLLAALREFVGIADDALLGGPS